MVFGTPQSLDNSVIKILATEGNSTAEDMLSTLRRDGHALTIQGMYRVLRRLQDGGVVIKEKMTYTLHLPWIIELTQFVERTEQVYFNEQYLAQLLPTTIGERRIWRFTNLFKIVDIWTHVLLATAKAPTFGPRPTALTITPHLWFAFSHTAHWLQFKKSFLSCVGTQYTIIGSQTFADKYLNALLKIPSQEHSYLSPPEDYPEKDRSVYRSIIGDYIISLKLDEETTRLIDTLFLDIKSEEDIRLIDIFELFTGKVRASLVIKKDPVKARRYWKKFERVFGPIDTSTVVASQNTQ